MPDKDFDNLFKDKFKDAEIEPSANLWAKIENQLEPKRKRMIPVYWMAAASVAIVFTALLVFQKTDKIQLHGNEVASVTVNPITTSLPVMVDEVAEQPVKTISPKPTRYAKVSISENNDEVLQPNENITRLAIKQQEPKVPELSVVTEVLRNETMIAKTDVPVLQNEPMMAQANPAESGPERNFKLQENTDEDRKGLFAFVGRVRERINKTTKNIITEKDGVVSIDLGLVTLQKNIN